jgi:hypothetical protein
LKRGADDATTTRRVRDLNRESWLLGPTLADCSECRFRVKTITRNVLPLQWLEGPGQSRRLPGFEMPLLVGSRGACW